MEFLGYMSLLYSVMNAPDPRAAIERAVQSGTIDESVAAVLLRCLDAREKESTPGG